MNYRILFSTIILSLLGMGIPLCAQQPPAPPSREGSSTSDSAAPKKKSIETQIREYEDFKKKTLARIEAIDATIEPAKDKLVYKLFEITPEEYHFLKLQALATDSANKFFTAKSAEVTLNQENIAQYFDEAYQAIKSGFLLYGQEQALVKQDVDLYNKIQSEIKKALLATQKGPEYTALMEEKDKLIESLKNVDPVLLYHMKRKGWFKSFPDLKATLEEAVAEKKASQ